MKLKKILKFAAAGAGILLALVLLLLGGLRLYFSDSRLRQMALDAAAQAFGRPGVLEITQVRLRLTGYLEVAGIKLRQPSTDARPPILQVDALRIRFRLLPLLRGRLVLEDVILERPELQLEQRAGQWNFQALCPPPATPTPAVAPAPSRPPALPLDVFLHRLELRDLRARLNFEDGSGIEVPSASMLAHASLVGPLATLSVTQTLQIPRWVATLNGRPPLELPLDETLELRVDLATGDLAMLHGRVAIPGLASVELSGRAEAFGQQNLELSDLHLNLDLQALTVRTADVLQTVSGPLTLQGTLDVHLQARGELPSDAHPSTSLRVDGRARLELPFLEASRYEARVESLLADLKASGQVSLPSGELDRPYDSDLQVQVQNAQALGSVLPGSAEFRLTLDTREGGRSRLILGHVRIPQVASLDLAGGPTDSGKAYSATLQVHEFHLDALQRMGLAARIPALARLALEGRVQATASIEGPMPLADNPVDALLCAKVDLKTSATDLRVSGEGLEARFPRLSLNIAREHSGPFNLAFEVPPGTLALHQASESGVSRLFPDKSLPLPNFQLNLTPSIQVSLSAPVPSASELESLSLPVTLDATLLTGITGRLDHPSSSLAALEASLEKFHARVRCQPASDATEGLEASLRLLGSPLQLVAIPADGQASRSYRLPELQFELPARIEPHALVLATTGDGVTFRVGALLDGRASFHIRELARKGFDWAGRVRLSLDECSRLLACLPGPVPGQPLDLSGEWSLDAAASGSWPPSNEAPDSPLTLRLRSDLALARAAYGEAFRMQALDPLQFHLEAEATAGPLSSPAVIRGKAAAAASGLSLEGTLPGQCQSLDLKCDFESRLIPAGPAPSFKTSGRLRASGLALLGQVSLGSADVQFRADSPRPDSPIEAGFSADLAAVRYEATGLRLEAGQALLRSEKTEVVLPAGEIRTQLSARFPEMGEAFEMRADARLKNWAETFEAHLEADALPLEKLAPWLSNFLFGPGTPESRTALLAQGPAQIVADARGRLPDAGQLAALRLPVELEARIDLKDGTLGYFAQGLMPPPATPSPPAAADSKTASQDPTGPNASSGAAERPSGPERPASAPAQPQMASLSIELNRLTTRFAVHHPASEGKLLIEIAPFQDADVRYADSALGEIRPPLSTSAPIRLNIEDLTSGRALFEEFPFTSGGTFTGTFRGRMHLYDLRETDLHVQLQVNLTELPDLLQNRSTGFLADLSRGMTPAGRGEIGIRIASAADSQAAFPDLGVTITAKPVLESFALESTLETGALNADLTLTTSYSLLKGEIGKVSLSGPVTIDGLTLLGGMLTASTVPISFHLDLKEKTLDELQADFDARIHALAFGSDAFSLPEQDASIRFTPSLHLVTGDLQAGGALTLGDWLQLDPFSLSARHWGEVLEARLENVTARLAQALPLLAAVLPNTLPPDLAFEGDPATATLSVSVSTPAAEAFAASHRLAFLKALLGPEQAWMPGTLEAGLHLPPCSLRSAERGLEIRDMTLQASASVQGENLAFSGKLNVPRILLAPLTGDQPIDPGGEIQARVKDFDELEWHSRFDLPAWGFRSGLDASVGGFASLHQGQDFLLDAQSLAGRLRASLASQLEFLAPQPRQLAPGLSVRGGVRLHSRLRLRPAQFLQVAGDLEMLSLTARYGDLAELVNLRGSFPFLKTYRIAMASPEEDARAARRVGPAPEAFTEQAGLETRPSLPAESYAFADQLRSYTAESRRIQLEAVLFRGRPLIRNLSFALQFEEDTLRIDDFRMMLLEGDVLGHVALATRDGRPRLEIAAEFAGIGGGPASRGAKTSAQRGINGNLRLELSLQKSRGSEEASIADLSGRFNLTRIDRPGLLALLRVADPQESDPQMNVIRQALSIGAPSSVRLDLRHGKLAGEVRINLPPPLGSQSIPLSELPVKQLLSTRSARRALSFLDGVQDALAHLAAGTLEFTPDGQIHFR
ncbi:MAG: AsmA family protein [Planctomycetes bacterium]|nr:AsmA family protein [Planctomycetota bacterium]